jgi:adenylate cyclase
MNETRKLTTILAADVAGYSRLAATDEERTLARFRALRSDLIDPAISVHHGRVVKRTGDGILVEFRSPVEAVRCAIEVQSGMTERNSGLPAERRIEFRIGIHLGDVVEESDGDLMGDGVNIAARLEGIAETGGICLSNAAYEQVRDKIDASFADLGEKELKNIARPVRVYRIDVALAVSATAEAPRPPLALPDKPSIAVLPFQNMSGDAEQDYFCDGMVEEIITGLARLKWLFVIARNSSFTYKGRAVDVREVGHELGVRYVLEGSVRRGGDRLRITAQLIEAATGNHLWADKYDGGRGDIFDLQDRITLDLVGAIEPSLQRAEVERSRRKRPDSIDAYDHYLRALPHLWVNNPADAPQALEHLDAALRVDSNYATAHGAVAWAYMQRFGRSTHDPADRAAALGHARAALQSRTDDATALAFGAFTVAILDRDYVTAFAAFDRAMVLNPNSALAPALYSSVMAFTGQYEGAVEMARKSIRHSPLDPMGFLPQMGIAVASVHAGHYAEAVEAASRSIQMSPRFGVAYVMLAAANWRLGRMDEARATVKLLLEIEPNYSIAHLSNVTIGPPEQMSALIDTLRAAGLPEE